MTSSGGRIYGGQSEDERRTDRRDRLLIAGHELFGTHGADETSIDRLCQAAGVSTRYFYEEFRSRDELLQEVYERACDLSVDVFLQSIAEGGPAFERVTRAVRTYVLHVTEDPGRIRLLHHDPRRQPVIQALRQRLLMRSWAGIPTVWSDDMPTDPGQAPSELSRRIRAVGGGMSEALLDWWSSPEPRPSREVLADEISRALVPAMLAPALRAA